MTQPTRREFISTSAKSVATVATVSALSTQTQVQATEKPLRVAVIGTGNQGSGHARVYNSMANAELVAICDLDPTRRAKLWVNSPNRPM